MSNYVKLINNLELLKLEKIKENIDQYIDLINNKKKDVVDTLYELTNLEIELRNEKAIYGCVRTAGFPFLKTFEDFDFSFQPTIITTNKPFGKWHEIFNDVTLANAILDRLLHHSHIININGNSYRLKNKIKIDSESTEPIQI